MANYLATVLADSPVAFYRMDDTSGTIAHDVSGNNYHATLTGNFTLNQPGALAGDPNTSIYFADAAATMSLPTNLNYTTFPAFSLEFWIQQSGGNWQYIVVTCDGSNTLTYLNGAQYSAGTVAPVEIYSLFAWAGSYNAAFIDEVAVYNTVLPLSRIQAHYTAANTTAITSQNTRYFKSQVVKIYDSSGNFLDIIKDAPYLTGFKININGATDAVKMILPRRIDAYDGANQPITRNTIVLGNIVQWWLYGAGLPAGGKLRYQGIIDTISPKIDESGGESVEVLVTPFSQIVGDHGISTTVTYGTAGSSATYIDTGAIFSSFFTGSYVNSSGATVSVIDSTTSQPYGAPYTLDPMSTLATGQKTQYAFQNQNLLSALTNVLLLSPANYFFRLSSDKTVYFGKYPTTATYTLLLGQHLTSIDYSVDNVPRKNLIVVQGKGVSATAVGSSVSTIGQRVYYKSDNRITDVATAQLLANGLLAFYDRPIIRATVKIPDYRGDGLKGLGFDIEQFKVGETLKIVDARATATSVTGTGSTWGSFVWGRDKWGTPVQTPAIWGSFTWGNAVWGANVGTIFNTVVPIVAITYDYHSVTLELGWKQPTMNRKLYDLEARFADASLVS